MNSKQFSGFLKNISSESLHVLDASIPKSKYTHVDLSESNRKLNTLDGFSSSKLQIFMNNHIKAHEALVAYGGYLEVRNIYKRSNHFNSRINGKRNIHLGLDLWHDSETPVFAILDGTVHSFKNNINYGDYGPTIILKHNISGVLFYTLYGHLSLDSINNLKIGRFFKKGELIAILGDDSVNGDYPPHLHFQIIKDIQGLIGDYPGVCSKNKLEYFKNNCPNPNILLKIDAL